MIDSLHFLNVEGLLLLKIIPPLRNLFR